MDIQDLESQIKDVSVQYDISEQCIIYKIKSFLNSHHPLNIDMSINKYTKSKLLPIAKHEAGHWVAANILGFVVKDINFKIIDSFNNHKCSVVVKLDFSSFNASNIIDYCEKRIQVLYSGALAQSLNDGKVDDCELGRIIESNASSDMEKARELIRIARC